MRGCRNVGKYGCGEMGTWEARMLEITGLNHWVYGFLAVKSLCQLCERNCHFIYVNAKFFEIRDGKKSFWVSFVLFGMMSFLL